jgi:hypothetical protein
MLGSKRRAAKRAADEAKRLEEEARMQKRAELIALLDRAEAGDITAQDKLVDDKRWRNERTIRDRLKKNGRVVAVRREYEDVKPRAMELETAWPAVETARLRLRTYVELVKLLKSLHWENIGRIERELGIKPEQQLETLNELIQARYVELLETRHEHDSFLALLKLIKRACESDLAKLGAKKLAYPDDWNELIARFFENPARGDFVQLPGFATGELRLMAAEALRMQDLTKAKIVLAHCKPYSDHYNNRDAWKYWRHELGDVLIADLTKMVSEKNAALDLTAVDESEGG